MTIESLKNTLTITATKVCVSTHFTQIFQFRDVIPKKRTMSHCRRWTHFQKTLTYNSIILYLNNSAKVNKITNGGNHTNPFPWVSENDNFPTSHFIMIIWLNHCGFWLYGFLFSLAILFTVIWFCKKLRVTQMVGHI